jgi:hypothetical protein
MGRFASLFGSTILWRAGDTSAPVHDQDFPKPPDHHIGGFQIAMDDAAAVSKRDRVTQLLKHS